MSSFTFNVKTQKSDKNSALIDRSSDKSDSSTDIMFE